MQLLVTLSIPKKNIVEYGSGNEGHIFERARIEFLDWEAKECVRQIEYQPPPENLGEGLSVRFTGGCARDGKWYQTSGTEIVVYNVADWSVERVISHPSFHDLHGLSVEPEGMAVVNTGLEMIQFLNMAGEIVREVNVATVPTWERFDRTVDYRRVVSTKPHEIHVNHAFKIEGRWWATRFVQRDAICLEDPQDRIDIGVGNPHDGLMRGGLLYFTTTDGKIVVADPKGRKVEEVVDLEELNGSTERLGWCRGLEVDGDFAYVGFTRLRVTKWKEVLKSIKNALKRPLRDSHIQKINLKRREVVDCYDYGRHGSCQIFTLVLVDRAVGLLPDA